MSETLESAVRKTTQALHKFTDTAHLDAEILVMLVTNNTREQLLAYPDQPLTSQEEQTLQDYIKRRRNGEPIAYIAGHKEFWSLDLIVTPDVLIPRPETEHLVEWILNHTSKDKPLSIADIGVGSGAIALALACECPKWQIDATEASEAALVIAKHNAKQKQLTNINFYLGNWCEPLPHQDYAVIVSNPPYIEEDDPHLKALKYEPKSALAAGKDGLDAIRIIIKQAKDYLADDGFLIFEHGYNQKDKIISLLKQEGYTNIKDHQDLAGLPRFVTSSLK